LSDPIRHRPQALAVSRQLALGLLILMWAGVLVVVRPARGAEPTLFERIGGEATLRPVIARLIERTAANPASHAHFDGIHMSYLEDSVYKFVCQKTGGGCDYDGETMERTHAGLGIQPSEFERMVRVLREELDRAGVPLREKNELLTILAPMKRDVVAHPLPTEEHATPAP
jgi:hemoglobin